MSCSLRNKGSFGTLGGFGIEAVLFMDSDEADRDLPTTEFIDMARERDEEGVVGVGMPLD